MYFRDLVRCKVIEQDGLAPQILEQVVLLEVRVIDYEDVEEVGVSILEYGLGLDPVGVI